MKCEICGKEVNKISACSDCGALFCERCGDMEKKICNECEGFEF